MYLFVYGTLKRGYHNHRLIRNAVYLCEAMLPNYCIYDLGAYPGISPKEGCYVIGELFRITDDMLPALDRLEGYFPDRLSESLYHRETVNVEPFVSEGFVKNFPQECFVYAFNNRYGYSRDIIKDGVWRKS